MSLIAPRRWVYESEHPLRYITMPGFFDTIPALRDSDRIDSICFGDTPPSHTFLVVDEVKREGIDKVTVSPLVEFKRKKIP
jgi:hypothetical protein